MNKASGSNSFHTRTIDEIFTIFSTNHTGLSVGEAKSRLEKYGPNSLPDKKPPSPIFIFIRQFRSSFVYILVIAATISLAFGKVTDFYVIAGILTLNAVMGFIQEYKAEKSIQALKRLVVPTTKVYRQDNLMQIPATELVPGDLIYLEEGDSVSADARIIELQHLSIVESSLTGESLPVNKHLDPLPENISIGDQKNMVFMGTFVASGNAKAIVVSTAQNTALGEIALSLESIEEEVNHFEKKTAILSKQMGIFAIGGALLTFIVGYFVRGFEFSEISFFTIATLVSAIPEGLPIVMVIVLAIGAHRMALRNVIIRKLSAAETLSITDVILTDKTGTLTQNVMSVEQILLPFGEKIEVSGSGWNPEGVFVKDNQPLLPLEKPSLNKLLHIASQVSNAKLVYKDKMYKIIGDPTEGSLVVLAEKAGLKKETLEEIEPRIDDYPFDQNLKLRAGMVRFPESDEHELYVAGAPESVLEKSTHTLSDTGKIIELDSKLKHEINKQITNLTNQAMRTIGLSFRKLSAKVETIGSETLNDLVFVGIVGIKDPARPGVRDAIKTAKMAGIRVIMATGDHKGTAIAIGKEIGLIDGKDKSETIALTGQELKDLSPKEFTHAVKNVSIFARLTPDIKLKIATEIQRLGYTVAMTGDGVNDAPALKKADVGISMGLVGTDVAREASDLVLTDDNFSSIINAVEEARIIFSNIRRTTYFLITTNFAELATILTTILIGLPLPLLPTQILWLNLVTDGLSVIALATEPGHKYILSQPPHKQTENILNMEVIPFIILVVIVMTTGTIFVFNSFIPFGLEYARTGAFVVMALTQLFNVYNIRSLKRSVFTLGLFSNPMINLSTLTSVLLLLVVTYVPFLQNIFEFRLLSFGTFLFLTAISASVWVIAELYKLFVYRKK